MQKLSDLKGNVLFMNVTSQMVVQIANYIIPLLLLPYVTRVLEAEAFGVASYAQNIGIYLTLLVNYGFEYSATQEVALNKENPEKLQSVFSTVIAFKLLLFLLSFAVIVAMYFLVPKVHDEFYSIFLVALLNLGWVLFPTWFFQGVERMAKMSVFTFFVKLLGAFLVIVTVSCAEDYNKYLLALTVANILVGAIAFWYLVREYKIKFKKPANFFHDASIRKGFPIFLNSILINTNTCLGVFLMGYFLTDTQIGVYSGAQKIITAIMMVSYQPLMIALFPRVTKKFQESKSAGWVFFKKCLGIITVYSLVVSVVTFVLAPLAVKIVLGGSYTGAVNLLKMLAPYPLLASVATTLTVHGLYGLQLHRFAPLIGLAVCITSVSLNFLLLPSLGSEGAIYAWMVCEVVEISIALGILLWKKGPI